MTELNEYKLKLKDIFNDYSKLINSIVVTAEVARLSKIEDRGNNSRHEFARLVSDFNIDASMAENDLKEVTKHIDDWFYITSWAVFERCIVEFFYFHLETIITPPSNNFQQQFQNKLIEKLKLDYWKKDESLDLLKIFVDTGTFKGIKQIGKYRDWLAHQNPKKKVDRSELSDPDTVYKYMKLFIDKLDLFNQNQK